MNLKFVDFSCKLKYTFMYILNQTTNSSSSIIGFVRISGWDSNTIYTVALFGLGGSEALYVCSWVNTTELVSNLDS